MRKLLLLMVLLIPLATAQSMNLNVSLSLSNPTCSDGIQNQGETGIDCGGPCAACPTCSDGIQNQGEVGVDCGGPCAACVTPSSGGGGGGGSPMFIVPPANDSTAGKTYLLIYNDSIVIDFNSTELAVFRLEIGIDEIATNVSVDLGPIQDQESLPDSKYLFQGFELAATNLDPDTISYINMWFRVPADWIYGKAVSFEGFLLLHYSDSWQPVATGFYLNDSEYFYFKSETASLGDFAIIGQEVVRPEPMPPAQDTNPFEKIIEIPVQVARRSGPIILKVLAVLVVVALLSGVIVFYIRHKPSLPREFLKKRSTDSILKDHEKRMKELMKKL